VTNPVARNIVPVGIAVVIMNRDGDLLLGKRRTSPGRGLYGFPGGHLEPGETWAYRARQEVLEECGPDLRIEIGCHLWTHNSITQNPDGPRHYVTLFLAARHLAGEAVTGEPDKCEGWEWMDYDTLGQLLEQPAYDDWLGGEDLMQQLRRM